MLLLALAGAWFFLQNREQLFPNSQEEEAAPPAAAAKASADPIGRAERLHKAGRTTTALSQLKRIPPSDPHYAKAQTLIAEWSGGSGRPRRIPRPGGAAGPGHPGRCGAGAPDAEASARRAALLAAARQASAQGKLRPGPRPAGAGRRDRQARRRRRPAPRRHPQPARAARQPDRPASTSTSGSSSSPTSGACTRPIRPTATSPS